MVAAAVDDEAGRPGPRERVRRDEVAAADLDRVEVEARAPPSAAAAPSRGRSAGARRRGTAPSAPCWSRPPGPGRGSSGTAYGPSSSVAAISGSTPHVNGCVEYAPTSHRMSAATADDPAVGVEARRGRGSAARGPGSRRRGSPGGPRPTSPGRRRAAPRRTSAPPRARRRTSARSRRRRRGRRRAGGARAIRSSAATVVRTRCGTCVDVHSVSRWSRSSHSARQARPSIGSAVRRAESKVSSSTSAAPSRAASRPGSSWKSTSRRTLPSSCTVGAPSARAASIDVTAGPGSYVDGDALRAVLGGVRRVGEDERDRLAGVADAVAGEQRHLDGHELGAVEARDERLEVAEVVRRDDVADARGLERGGGVDPGDARGAVGRADDRDRQQARAPDVVDERRGAGEVAGVLDAADRPADPAPAVRGRLRVRHRQAAVTRGHRRCSRDRRGSPRRARAGRGPR